MKTFALAGNPNCGKTTLFNALTGSTAHVGNWPGVTVDKREGVYKGGKERVAIIDLPGIYSLSPYTPEEVISRNYILDEKPDAIINIVDATNLERNLYLTTQILEMDVPVIIALNMIDEVEKRGDTIDVKALEKAIGVPVVAISALKNVGMKELMDRAIAMPATRKGNTVIASALGDKLEKAKEYYQENEMTNVLFHAIKLLEADEIELERKGAQQKLNAIKSGDEDLEATIADARYQYISANFSISKKKSQKPVLTKSDKADRVLTNRYAAIPIFLVILLLIFHFTFSEDLFFLGAIFKLPSLEDLGLMDGDEYVNVGGQIAGIFYNGGVNSPGVILANVLTAITDAITNGIVGAMQSAGAAEWAVGLVGDGILGGIFAVLGFLPQILTLFLFFSILEDSGYMARVAFILDRIFRKFGLSGRAFMPMIMGFGCSVPAAINTRTLADEKERTTTIRVIPFFSCGAKLPILVAMGGTVCAIAGLPNVDLITYSMYLVGVVSAIVCVLVMRNTTQKGETPPFIMELPTYHLPGFKNLMLHLWDKCKHFVKKAFTIIFASTVIIWLFSHLDWSWNFLEDESMGDSILAAIGKFIQPIFTPLGFGYNSETMRTFGWVFAVAALTGLIAKENVIATFGVLAASLAALGANTELGGITETLGAIEGIDAAGAMVAASGISVAGILAFITFNMTTIPCFAACATAKAELPKGKFKWTVLFWLVASYIISACVFTVVSAWWSLFIWLAVFAGVGTLIVFYNKGKIKMPFKKKANKDAANEK
jgi:ferrous iron transport protein B